MILVLRWSVAWPLAALSLSMHDVRRSPPSDNVAIPPIIATISPTTAITGTGSLTLIVNGSNFDQNAQVRWNGATRTTTYVSPSRLQAAIAALDIAAPVTAQVTVFNPNGSATSNAVTFSVANPAPTIASASPSPLPYYGEDISLRISGTGFMSSTVVRLNDVIRTATVENSTSLYVRLTADDLKTLHDIAVTVATPAPGGGTAGPFAVPIRALTPIIERITPDRILVGDTRPIWIEGQNFVRGVGVVLNGDIRVALWENMRRLRLMPSASDVSSARVVSVTVFVDMPRVDRVTSSPAYFTIGNPSPGISTSVVPVIERLQPAELTFSGTNIMSGIRATIGRTARPTTVVTASQVRVKLDTLDAGTTGSFTIRFENPSPTFGASSPTVSVVNPIPIATELTPKTVTVGGPAFTLTIKGNHFVPESIVKVNGNPRMTTYVNTGALRANIPASDLAAGGDLPITVASPPPRGGTSATLNLSRLYPQIIVK